MADDVLGELARLINELGQVLGRLRIDQAASSVPTARRCEDCGRTARQLIPVLDPAGRTTGWVGPTCLRNRQANAGRGTQLPLEQQGADRG